MTTVPACGQRLWTSAYATTVGATVLVFVAIGITIPVLPFVVTDALGAGDRAVGLVFAAAAVSAVLGRPLLGRLGDTRGRRALLRLGCVLCALGLVGHLLAQTMATLVLARLVLGAGQAAVMVAATTLAIDLAPQGRRGEASSFLFIAVQVGLGTGPAIGEAVRPWGLGAVWITATTACLVASGLSATLPRVARPGTRELAAGNRRVRVDHGVAIRTGLLAGLGTLGFAGYLAFLPLYAVDVGVETTAGIFLLASGTIAVVRSAAAKLPDRLGPRRVAGGSLAMLTAGFVVLAAWHSLPGLLVGTLVMAAGMSLLVPSLVLSATDGVSEGEETRRMSTFTLFLDLAAALGPSLLGIVAADASYAVAFLTCGAATLLALALLPRWIATLPPRPRTAV
ncbi:MFS transporter [Nocardioides acrostichi]|uniref:MFS transporter n=1 Tax=Nocardioides acrostichi TaxID=2784339 RepID=A0A930YDR2_9ACTN|nr:MFS transporter [Nocardioides acrostichi]MBF4162714.1 MFS transporter [Nocardioides acrostichi]